MSTRGETEEQEISAIEQGFKQALVNAFNVFYIDSSGDPTKWRDGAVIRFRKSLACARAVRALALKTIAEEIKT